MTRREFAGTTAALAACAAASRAWAATTPWYRRTFRWGQINITEKDPVRFDIPWWRDYWKRTFTQGVILNAGGIVAYYISKYPLHHRAEFLGNRDLYGELAAIAHADGLAVVARMDSSRTAEDFYRAHPDWFARNAAGEPYRVDDKFMTCIHGPYYEQYLPDILREIIERSHPEGLTDNSWAGLNRDSICYCENCARKFRDQTGFALPKKRDWGDRAYRQWIEWSYARRVEIWDLNNRVTRAAGGPDCLWIGMNSGSIPAQSRSFRDCKAIWSRAGMLFMDHQSRGAAGFQENADTGKLIHGVLGWDKLMPESMAMYGAGGRATFRMTSKPAAEARMWMIEGFAGGIQPWWHHVGAYQEDRRMFHTAEPMMRFYRDNEKYLTDRRPLATVGLVWSQRNTDYYGQDNAAELTEMPYRGFMQAMIRGRIPYVPVHIDDIERHAAELKVMILPAMGAMSDAQCQAVRRYVAGGGTLIASGPASLYDEWGDARRDFALGDLLGAHLVGDGAPERAANAQTRHTYLRLNPELRHSALLRGFEETEILPYGGVLKPLRVDAGTSVALTFVPAFPAFPPETAWMREPRTDIPGLILKDRVAFLTADLDARYGRDNLPDHGDLLANLVRWAAAGNVPLEVRGPGLLDCNAYTQPGRVILHLVNLSNTGRMPIEEFLPVGPIAVRVRLPRDVAGRLVRMTVSGAAANTNVENGWAAFQVERVEDHEMVILE